EGAAPSSCTAGAGAFAFWREGLEDGRGAGEGACSGVEVADGWSPGVGGRGPGEGRGGTVGSAWGRLGSTAVGDGAGDEVGCAAASSAMGKDGRAWIRTGGWPVG